MHKIKLLFTFFVILILIHAKSFSQKTLEDIHPVKTFQEAMELYDNKKYNAAIEMFSSFIKQSENHLLNSKAEYHIALCALKLDLKNTEGLFLKYLEKYPEQNQDISVYFLLGKYKFNHRDYDEVVEWLSKIKHPRQLEIPVAQEYHFMLGYSYFKEDLYDNALTSLSEIDAYANPYFNMANYYKGYIFYKQGRYEESLKKFLNITETESFRPIVPSYITHIYLKLGEYQKVIDYGENALYIPNIQRINDIRSYLAEAYFNQKKYQKTIDIFDQLRGNGYRMTQDNQYNYGYSLFQTEKYKDAIDAFSYITINNDEKGQNISYLKAIAYLKQDEEIKARNLFLFAATLDFDKYIQEVSHLNYAKLSYELNEQREAINYLRSFLVKFPKSKSQDEVKSLISNILLNTKNYKEALEIIESIEDKNEDVKAAYQKISYFYGLDFFLQNKYYTKARDLFVQSIKNAVDKKYLALAYFWLAESYYELEDYDNAIREYKNFQMKPMATHTPYYSLGYYNIAYCYFKKEDYDNAGQYFEKYIDAEKTNTKNTRYYDGIIRSADCYFATRKFNEAVNYYNINIAKGSQEVDYCLYQKATISGLLDDTEQKMITLNNIITKYPDSRYVDDATYEIADMHFLEGDYNLAIDKFNYLLQEHPTSIYSTAATHKVGLAYYNIGNEDKALNYFMKIIEDKPYSPVAKEAFNGVTEIYVERGNADSLLILIKVMKINLSKTKEDSIFYHSAYSFIKRDQYEEAINAFQSYLEKFPKGFFKVSANYYIAYSALIEKDYVMALEYFENVNNMAPNEFLERSIKYAANLFFDNEEYENARVRYGQLEEIAKIRDNVLLSKIGQMKCLYELDEYEYCISMAEKILPLSEASVDDKTEAQYYIGKSYFNLNKYDLAVTNFKAVSEKNTADLGAESMYLIAEVLYIQENYDEAINTILELKAKYSYNVLYITKGFILLSDVFVKIGDLFQARKTLESIIKSTPNAELKQKAEEKLEVVLELEKEKEESLKFEQEVIEMSPDSLK
jgi:TolA-binding protein